MRVWKMSLAIVIALVLAQQANEAQIANRRIAVTLDDGPSVENPSTPGIPMKDLAKAQKVAARLMAALQAEEAPATIFINESQLNVPGERDARVEVLEKWLDAGFDLAN